MSKNTNLKQQKKMVGIPDGAFYAEMVKKAARDRAMARADRIAEVVEDFEENIRPLMRVNTIYGFNEMLDLFRNHSKSIDRGMFRHLLLNDATSFRLYHIKAMPSHIMFAEIPEDPVKTYYDWFEEVEEKARKFTEETGIEVPLPDKEEPARVKALADVATEIMQGGACERVGGIIMTYLNGARASVYPSDFKTYEKMGIKFTVARTVSSFWIED